VCTDCVETQPITADEAQVLEIDASACPSVSRGRGCERCGQTGYRGRVGLYELLTMSDEIRHQIASGADANSIREQAIKDGMRTLRQDALDKLRAGITTPEEVVRVTRAV
jgi:general secretion pathway protein E